MRMPPSRSEIIVLVLVVLVLGPFRTTTEDEDDDEDEHDPVTPRPVFIAPLPASCPGAAGAAGAGVEGRHGAMERPAGSRREGMAEVTRRQLIGAGTAAVGMLAWGDRPAIASIDPRARKPAPQAPFKLSVAAYSYRQFLAGAKKSMTLFDFIDRCAAMGTDGVELTEYYFDKPVTPEYVSRLKYRAHLLGQSVSGTPVGNVFTHPAGPARDAEVAKVKQWIDVSADLGSPAIRIFAGNAPNGVTEAEARRNAVECIEGCCDHAARRGVFLALENHGGVVATPDGLLEIIHAVQCPWVGVNLDTGNFRSTDPYADLARCAPYAVTVQHKTEVTRSGRKEPSDFARVVKLLRDANYRGFITLEHEAQEDPMEAVPRHVAAMRKLLGS
jgi:sugar phosphate isomerase/epimerase